MDVAINNRGHIPWPLSSFTRHGLIAGGSGSGKSVTLKLLAERLADNGIPCFVGDIKGDLGGFASAGELNKGLISHCKNIGASIPESKKYNVQWLCPFGNNGLPVHLPIDKAGPTLLGSVLDISNAQRKLIYSLFRIAKQNNFLCSTLDDFRNICLFSSDNNVELSRIHGSMHRQSISGIIREIAIIEDQGGSNLFRPPGFDYRDLMKTNENGEGIISILDCKEIVKTPTLYACLLIWLLLELYDNLPELGRVDKPILVLFFDEAHLIFRSASRALTNVIENAVRLIRSKGVGIIFASQSPADIPDAILGQLGSRVQHAMRAATPRDMKSVRSAADTMPAPTKKSGCIPHIDIGNLATGEALVSFLMEDGSAMPTERAYILPPSSKIGQENIEDGWQAEKERRERERMEKERIERKREQEIIAQNGNKKKSIFSKIADYFLSVDREEE